MLWPYFYVKVYRHWALFLLKTAIVSLDHCYSQNIRIDNFHSLTVILYFHVQGMTTSETRKKIAEELECHFKWKPSGEHMECDVNLMENKLLSCLEENHLVKVQAYSLLAYIFSITISGIQPNHQKGF